MQTIRKVSLILLAAVLIGLSALPVLAAPNYVMDNPGTTSLVSWWTLNEASGTRNDSHGTNHLSDNNTVTSNTGVQSDAAVFVSSNSEYLSIADNSSVSTGAISWTLCGWAYLTDTTATKTIASKFNPTGNQREFLLRKGTTYFELVVTPNGALNYTVTSTTSPSTNTWYLVCGWHDKVGQTLNIQVNNGTVTQLSYTLGSTFDSTSPFQIGAYASTTAFLDGRVDEVVFYKRILTANEREWLYNSGAGRTYSEVVPTPTPTNTPIPATETFTPSNTPLPPTETFTPSNTPVPPTATFTASNTPLPITDTFTPSSTPTDTATPTITLTPTVTRTYTPTITPGGPDMPVLNWNGDITYGDFATTMTISLLCLIVILGGAVMFTLNTLNRKKDR